MKYSSTRRKHAKKHRVSKTRKSRGGGGGKRSLAQMSGEEVTNEKERLEEEVKKLEGEIMKLKRENKEDPTFEPSLRGLLHKNPKKLNEITDAHGQSHEYGHLHPNVIQKVLELREKQNRLKEVKELQRKQMLYSIQEHNPYDPYYELTKRTRRS